MNLQRAFLLHNPIQPYAWGSRTAIAALLGLAEPAREPQAELWMGAHPKAPSMVAIDGVREPLDRLIQRFPESILGARTAARFGATLPFLFKVLAVAEPLSIQAHPDRRQAAQGFERENRAGLSLDAPQRNYRDPNHKPELVCALSEFWALDGFRPIEEMREHLQPLCARSLDDLWMRLEEQASQEGIRFFFNGLMCLEDARRKAVVQEAVARARQGCGQAQVCRWVVRLAESYPEDIGVLAPALLNLVRLNPGEALFVPAGRLHAYLEGTAIEIMANSDNVLRGGLTPKHVDAGELLRILRFDGGLPEVLQAQAAGEDGRCYATPAEEFALWVIRVDAKRAWQSPSDRAVEILLCTEGSARLTPASGPSTPFAKGCALLVPAAAGAYAVSGRAVVYRAALPQGD